MAASDPDSHRRWRTRLLFGAALPLLIVAGASVFQFAQEVRDYLDDADLRLIARPYFLLLAPFAVTVARLLLAAAVLLALYWRRADERSRRSLGVGYAAMLPLLVVHHLVPTAWSYDLPAAAQDQAGAILSTAGPALAIGGALDLTPLLPAIAVGLARAGMQRLRAQAGDAVGALVAGMGSLQVTIFAAILLAVCEPMVGDHLAVRGLGLITLHYAMATMVCLHLARRARGQRRWATGLLTASSVLLLAPGLVCALVGIHSIELFEHRILAVGDQPGLLTVPQAAVQLCEFAGRALCTATVVGDLLHRALDSGPGAADATPH